MRNATSLELVISNLVRDWAMARFTDPSVAEAAVGIALDAYAGGASMREACLAARNHLDSEPARLMPAA